MKECTSFASTSHNYNERSNQLLFNKKYSTTKHEEHKRTIPRPDFTKKSKEEVSGDMEVSCMNCMKMIKISLVSEHSLKCSKVESTVQLLDQCSVIQQADYKLKKLEETLIKLNKESGVQGSRYYTQMLLEYCKDILEIGEYTKTDILRCREVVYNLNALLKGFKGSQCVSIQMERLLSIAKEKYGQLLMRYKEIMTENNNVMSSRRELEKKVEARTYKLRETLNLVSKARNTIISGSKYKHNKRTLSPSGIKIIKSSDEKEKLTEKVVETPERRADSILNPKEEMKGQEEITKHYFKTIVNNAKKALSKTHIGYYADSSLLFNEVIKRKISVEQWPDFILKELNNNPRKWIQPGELLKLEEL